MAPTYTARLGLRKPNVADFYDIADDNFNADTVDANIQNTVCTSGTRPATPWNGQTIYETDTFRFYVYITGTGWRQIMLGLMPSYVPSANGSTALYMGWLYPAGSLAGNRLIAAQISGAANPGYIVDFDGRTQWGPGGATTPDVNLYRDSANVLATDDGLWCKHASMETVTVVNTVSGTTTSTSFTDTLSAGSPVAVNFTAPPSGKIKITVNTRLAPGTAGQVAKASCRISGTAGTYSSTDERSVMSSIVADERMSVSWIITGLAALTTGTATMQFAVTGGTAASFNWKSLIIEPQLN